MLPVSGFKYPVTIFIKVVLPAPLEPIRDTLSPFLIPTLISFAATTAPKDLFIFSALNKSSLLDIYNSQTLIIF